MKAGDHVVRVNVGRTMDDEYAVLVTGRDVDWHAIWYASELGQHVIQAAVDDWLASYTAAITKEQRPS